MACTWEGAVGVGEFVLLLNPRCCCCCCLAGDAGSWCGLLLCTVKMSECNRNDSLTPKVSSLMFLHCIWLCTSQSGDTGWAGLRGCERFLRVNGKFLQKCHHSGVWLTVKVSLVEMNAHLPVTVSMWLSGQIWPLCLWEFGYHDLILRILLLVLF